MVCQRLGIELQHTRIQLIHLQTVATYLEWRRQSRTIQRNLTRSKDSKFRSHTPRALAEYTALGFSQCEGGMLWSVLCSSATSIRTAKL